MAFTGHGRQLEQETIHERLTRLEQKFQNLESNLNRYIENYIAEKLSINIHAPYKSICIELKLNCSIISETSLNVKELDL